MHFISKKILHVTQPEGEELSKYIDYENPIPSTSADNLITKKRVSLQETKLCNAKKKILWKSDDSSEDDNYSLRDSSKDECFIPSKSESCEDVEGNAVQEIEEKCKTSPISVNSYVLVKFCGPKTNKDYVGKFWILTIILICLLNL